MNDPIDIRIIGLLQRDGRATYEELGREVGLSAPSVFSRVRRLRESGAISGFSARVDPAVFGYGVLAFVRVELDRASDAQALIDRFASSPDCEACYRLGHADELLVRIRLRSLEELSAHLEAIRRSGGRARAELVVRTVFERDFTPRLV